MDKPQESDVEDFISRLGRTIFDEPAMCTGWVLVCEWSNGVDYWTSTFSDEESPPWRTMGLLNYANNTFDYEEESEDEFDSEE